MEGKRRVDNDRSWGQVRDGLAGGHLSDDGPYNFTERARRVLDIAFRTAREFRHPVVLPLHVASAVLEEGSGVAMTALRFHGITADDLEPTLTAALEKMTGGASVADPVVGDEIAELLVAAEAEATSLGHRYLGTDHLLLALLRDPTSVLARALEERHCGLNEARARIQWVLTANPMNPEAFAPPPA